MNWGLAILSLASLPESTLICTENSSSFRVFDYLICVKTVLAFC